MNIKVFFFLLIFIKTGKWNLGSFDLVSSFVGRTSTTTTATTLQHFNKDDTIEIFKKHPLYEHYGLPPYDNLSFLGIDRYDKISSFKIVCFKYFSIFIFRKNRNQ